MRTSCVRLLRRGVVSHQRPFVRFSSTSAAASDPPHRLLADVKKRIGKCINFGLQPMQADEAGSILRLFASDWKELLAGSEGFLVGRSKAGLEGHRVAWGEMVCAYGTSVWPGQPHN